MMKPVNRDGERPLWEPLWPAKVDDRTIAQPQRCALPQEIELKLVLSASDAEAFIGSGPVAAQPTRQKLHTVYFDTPERALLGAGLSLRIRRSGRQRVQTIKSAGSGTAGLFERQEWECPVSSPHPQLDQDTPVAALLGRDIAALAPAFEVKVERLTWLLEDQTASIELVLDRGMVRAANRQAPICELELELKHGKAQTIFAMARRIAELVPVRPGVMTKAERGYALLGPARDAFKAETIHFGQETSSAEAFRAIAGQCLRQYRLNEALLLTARHTEALHQARVALRRLRSAIAIFQPLLDEATVAHLQSELRWLTGVLAQARDIDVLLPKTEPGALQDHLQQAGDKAYAEVIAGLGSARARGMLLDLVEWLAVGAWREDAPDLPVSDFAEKALSKLRKRVKKRGASLATLSDEQRHRLRKAAKRLRYGAEFFASLFPGKKHAKRCRKFTASLEVLQDDLGELNDRATAPHLFARLGLRKLEGADALLTHRKTSRIMAASQEALSDLMDHKRFWI